MSGVKQDYVQTLTRAEIMKAREEDAEKIKSGEVKIGIQKVVKGYNV